MATTKQRYDGIDRLYGHGTVATLRQCHVAVVGVGGVGSWAAEAFARSGVGRITLIDADEVCVSNTNRQSHALSTTVGRSKVGVLTERLLAIDPTLGVVPLESFVTTKNLEQLIAHDYDLVLDACDALRIKVDLIAFCKRRRIPVVVSGSAGGRSDPTQIRVRDLAKTEHDMLLARVRAKLRDEYGWTRNPKRYFGVPAVYSLEQVRYVNAAGKVCTAKPAELDGSMKLDCRGGLGAAMHVTATFGMIAVARALEKLLERKRAAGSAEPE